MECLNRPVEAGHTVLVIEHHVDVIKCADYIVDVGPEGGHNGGEIVARGTPEAVAATPASHTGQFLRAVLACPSQAADRTNAVLAGASAG